jgi:hypothetical protein
MRWQTEFIHKDDPWGATKLIREIWAKETSKRLYAQNLDAVYKYNHIKQITKPIDLLFWIFFNQFVPPPWKVSTDAVKRHIEDIRKLIDDPAYSPYFVWIKRSRDMKCVGLDANVVEALEKGAFSLPLYEEIEAERNKWQNHENYHVENGKTQPILEEYVQLRFKPKGGESIG